MVFPANLMQQPNMMMAQYGMPMPMPFMPFMPMMPPQMMQPQRPLFPSAAAATAAAPTMGQHHQMAPKPTFPAYR